MSRRGSGARRGGFNAGAIATFLNIRYSGYAIVQYARSC